VTATFTSVNGIALKCGQYSGSNFSGSCPRPATFLLARIADGVDYSGRTHEYSDYEIGRNLYCNVHRGAQARIAARPGSYAETQFYGVDAPEAEKALARYAKAENKRRAEAAVESRKKTEERTKQQRLDNEKTWADYATRVEVVEKVENETRWTGNARTLYTFGLDVSGVPEWRLPRVEVEVNEPGVDDNWWEIEPVEVRVRSTWNADGAVARAMAEALTLAARVAERETTRIAAIRAAKKAAVD
jgi:hypothetical protein